jgi:hypothetical protein
MYLLDNNTGIAHVAGCQALLKRHTGRRRSVPGPAVLPPDAYGLGF